MCALDLSHSLVFHSVVTMLHLSLVFLLQLVLFKLTLTQDNIQHLIQHDINSLKIVTKTLTDNLEKWNDLFLNTIQPQIVSAATSLATIDSNVGNLQERAHIWDTFQLHVAAWNDQLASLDRKADIISKGQEKLLEFESKLNRVANVEPKIDDALRKIDKIQDAVATLKEESLNNRLHKDHDNLFGEFATRGILSTVKMIEKKLDRLVISQDSVLHRKVLDERPKLTIKCNTPRFVEDLLNDISSKVDVIFDKINDKDEGERDFVGEDYEDGGSGSTDSPLELKLDSTGTKEIRKRDTQDDVLIKPLTKLIQQISTLENISVTLLNIEVENLEKTKLVLAQCSSNSSYETKLEKVMNNNFVTQKKVLESLFANVYLKNCSDENYDKKNYVAKTEPKKKSCEDLDETFESGIYFFGNSSRIINKRFCFLRNDEFWTVIQRRDNNSPQNFNLTWSHYKTGFGKLNNDFWFGNDYISELSRDQNLVLRVELTDFSGKHVWAEYDTFQVLPEENKYQIIIGGYRGNASDSFSSHNGSFFSTFDQKNDQAPECCPCAVSYGGGWWFNSCFESNLNGLYYRLGENNGYYGGIIWETWLGNYSLKKTLMMVRSAKKPNYQTSTLWPYYEDP